MKILGFIPARAGSKGIPHKNRVKLGGKPLYQWVRDTAIRSRLFDKLIVSTDDIVIQKTEPLAIERPEHLSCDNALVIDAVIHHLRQDYNYDFVAMLQPTSPLLRVQDIKACVSMLKDNPDLDSVHTVVEVDHHNHAANQRYIDGAFAKFCYPELRTSTNKQDKREHYTLGNFILSKMDTVFKYHNLYGEKIGYKVIPRKYAIDIDTQEDLEYARYLISAGIEL